MNQKNSNPGKISKIPPASGGLFCYAGGVKVYADKMLLIQFRFPRCKSKRISKKFKKDKGLNFKPDTSIYRFRDMIICHPVLYDRVVEGLTV